MRERFLTTALVACLTSSLFATVSNNVPLHHWAYSAIDKMTETGLLRSDMPGVRPYSRREVARLTLEANDKASSLDYIPSTTRAILKRLQDEFAHEISLRTQSSTRDRGSLIKPLEDPYVRYVYGKHIPSLENNNGDEFIQGDNWRAGFITRGVLWDTFAYYLNPEYQDPPFGGSDKNVRFIQGYGKVGLGPVEIQLGKDNLFWGPGQHSGMIMTNNAQGFTMLKVSNPEPVLLPWVFRSLGPFKAVYFLTKLEKDRFQPEARLTGIRFNVKPHPNVDLGFSRTIMFGGDNFDTGYWDYLQIFWPKNIQGSENQLGAFDMAFRIPSPKFMPWRATKLYGEFGSEDSAGLSKYRPNIGLHVQDIGWLGSTDFRIEYAKTHIGRFPGVFYRHHLFQSGYTYKGHIVGHHQGADVRDIFARLQHYLNGNMIAGLYYDQEVTLPAQQTRNQYGIDFTWFTKRNWELKARYQYEDIKNDSTRPRWNHILDLGLTYNF